MPPSQQHIRQYFDEFRQISGSQGPICSSETPLGQFYQIFSNISSPGREFCAAPGHLLRCLRQETGHFQPSQHHDCYEFFIFLIESFSRTIAELNGTCGSKFPSFAPLFEGKRSMSFSCNTCGYHATSGESFSSFYLALEQSDDDFQTRIDKLTRPQVLGGTELWRCDECQAGREATVTADYERLPPICLVQLQRFRSSPSSRGAVKVLSYLEIPKNLALRQGADVIDYQLRTMVVHLGRGIEKGHYVALLRFDDVWILADDSKLSRLSQEGFRHYTGLTKQRQLNDPVPYVLFYERE
jgi:ubiquitin C-terminal hydrolase